MACGDIEPLTNTLIGRFDNYLPCTDLSNVIKASGSVVAVKELHFSKLDTETISSLLQIRFLF